MCEHEQVECPNHEGGFDCTPFCRICEGNQGYCPICEPIQETCNCLCGCEVPLSAGTCVDCGEGDHQNNNELTQFLQPLEIRDGEVIYLNDEGK